MVNLGLLSSRVPSPILSGKIQEAGYNADTLVYGLPVDWEAAINKISEENLQHLR